MFYALGIIIPLLSFCLQSYPRLFNKYFGVDVWTRLLEIQHVKNAHHKIPQKIQKGFIIDGYFDYPIVFPWLFSFFSKKTLLNYQGFVSPLFDCLQNYFVFLLAFNLTHNVIVSMIAQIIYTLTPMIPIENSYMTPRSLGYLLFTLSFTPLLYFSITHQPLYLFVGFIFTCILFITHRFALQSFILISIFFTLVDQSFIYLGNLILAFIIIVLLTKGYYLRVAKGHWSNIYFWVINYKYRFAHQIYGNKKTKKLDWVAKIYNLLSYFSPLLLFGISLWTFSGFLYVFLYFYAPSYVPVNMIYIKFSLWIIFFYLFGAIVLKVKRLIPIGEGQRYIEMSTVPASILSAIIFYNFYLKYPAVSVVILTIFCLVNLVLILFIQIKGIIGDKNRSLTKELEEIFQAVNKLPGTPRIMCIPHQITTMTVYHTKADVLVNADNPGLLKNMEVYPILTKSIEYLKKKYKLNYIVVRESYVKLKDLKIIKYKIIKKSDDILLIKL